MVHRTYWAKSRASKHVRRTLPSSITPNENASLECLRIGKKVIQRRRAEDQARKHSNLVPDLRLCGHIWNLRSRRDQNVAPLSPSRSLTKLTLAPPVYAPGTKAIKSANSALLLISGAFGFASPPP
jgi:hypothetical protein